MICSFVSAFMRAWALFLEPHDHYVINASACSIVEVAYLQYKSKRERVVSIA